MHGDSGSEFDFNLDFHFNSIAATDFKVVKGLEVEEDFDSSEFSDIIESSEGCECANCKKDDSDPEES